MPSRAEMVTQLQNLSDSLWTASTEFPLDMVEEYLGGLLEEYELLVSDALAHTWPPIFNEVRSSWMDAYLEANEFLSSSDRIEDCCWSTGDPSKKRAELPADFLRAMVRNRIALAGLKSLELP